MSGIFLYVRVGVFDLFEGYSYMCRVISAGAVAEWEIFYS